MAPGTSSLRNTKLFIALLSVLPMLAVFLSVGCSGSDQSLNRSPVVWVEDAPDPKKPGQSDRQAKPDRPTQSGDRASTPERAQDRPGTVQNKRNVVSMRGRNAPPTYEAFIENMQATLIRQQANREPVELITPNRQRIWTERGDDSLAPKSIDFVEAQNGFDLIFRFQNDTNESKRLGQIVLGGIRFPESIVTRAVENDGKPIALSHDGRPYFGGGMNYPGGLYSPVAVIQGGADTVGVSLHYDVREYRHRVFIRVESPGGIYTHGGNNWQVRFVFDRDDEDPGGRINPGESRHYQLSVRTHHGNPAEWVRTLEPYRDFYRKTYGSVRYQRDPRPVRARALSQNAAVTADNPRGFLDGPNRADIAGLQPLIDRLQGWEKDGFERVMVWTPSGMYAENTDLNFTFNMTTGMKSVPMIEQTMPLLSEYASGPVDFGLWWGRTSYIMPREWDTGPMERFSHRNSHHVDRAWEELDIARELNATLIGLDAISGMPAWDAYEWLQMMQNRYPEMTFVTETLCADFLHTLAPSFVRGTRVPENHRFAAITPMMLADFLNPGHETWAQISGQDVKINAGLPPSAPVPVGLFYERCRKAAYDGYVPVVFGPVPSAQGLRAAESWLRTVPADLRE